jgi:hypothetical protein
LLDFSDCTQRGQWHEAQSGAQARLHRDLPQAHDLVAEDQVGRLVMEPAFQHSGQFRSVRGRTQEHDQASHRKSMTPADQRIIHLRASREKHVSPRLQLDVQDPGPILLNQQYPIGRRGDGGHLRVHDSHRRRGRAAAKRKPVGQPRFEEVFRACVVTVRHDSDLTQTRL